MVSGDYDYNPHIGSVSDETYRLVSGTIRRESGVESGRRRERGLYAALRASWNWDERFSWRNLVSYSRISTPEYRITGYVDFSSLNQSETYVSYSATAGWASHGWNLRLSLVNLFRSSWRLSEDCLNTRFYDSRVTQYGSDHHRRISLSITYTFNYSKRVSRDGELSGEKNISTSILH